MFISFLSIGRTGALAAVVGIAGVQTPAQTGRGRTDSVGLQVTAALAHGSLADARRIVHAAGGAAASRELAAALIDIFEGKDDDARRRLEPLAAANPRGDAALELGLLEALRGRRSEAKRWLEPVAANRVLNSNDDYFRLARAARAMRYFQLANDAYQRIADVPRADIQTGYADLFLQHDQPGDAVTNYRKAIEVDRTWVPAYVGLSRALGEDHEQVAAAREALAAAREIAPDHPEVLILSAERELEAEDVDATKQLLDRLAKARPGTIDEAALRVAIAYEEKGAAAVEPAISRFSLAPPLSALAFRYAGLQAARNYRFDEAAALARKAVLADSDDPASHADLGLYLLRTGDEKQARQALERAFELGGNSNRVTYNLLQMLDSLDKFEVVEAGEFIFKFSSEEAAVLKAYALPLSAEAYKVFSSRYGFKPSGPLLIEIFPKHDDFAVRTIGLPGLVGALGACFGRVVSMDSPRARPPGDFSWQATLWHELAHVFTLQMSQYRLPRWLSEGISVYEEHRRQPAWGRELTLEFASQLARGRTFGVKGLPNAFKRPESLALAYFEASLAVEHLVELNGDQGLRTLLRAYADGASDADAFSKAFGRTVDAVDASFKTFVDKRFGALKNAMSELPRKVDPGDVTALTSLAASAPGNYIAQLMLGQALLKAGNLAGAKAALERAAQLAPPASGDASPRALLAEIAEKEQDIARARRELRQLLAFDHTNVNAARKLLALVGDGQAADDRDFALRLIADLDPFDADAHTLLGRRLLEKGDHAAALVEFQAVVALNPTNIAEARTDLADALLKLGRRDEAKREALIALQHAPTFARAQDILLAAIGK